MEEDLKVLEEFINLSFLYGKLTFTKTQLYRYQKAVANLINRNKELEFLLEANEQKAILKNYIPKSKVREKIEELKKEGDYRDIYNPTGRVHFMKEVIDYQIEILQELLQEGDK